eukprot:gb/GEZN01008239.1/.p1 GENE.gb/GEZN01008239.1/~~gb/GEZN01008239.1/.p1  ORF type:complete len:388 (-),score=90.71 gb/GEZN01008239.1/:288-1409(-)
MLRLVSNVLGDKNKNPSELVKITNASIGVLKGGDKDAKEIEKAQSNISQSTAAMKFLLYGDDENVPKPEVLAKLTDELLKGDTLVALLSLLSVLDFEARRSIEQVWTYILRQSGKEAMQFAQTHKLVPLLALGYSNHDVALHTGAILREAIRHSALAQELLASPEFFKFFDYVSVSEFDVASDAFLTFQNLLTKHLDIAAKFLAANYDKFFPKYTKLLESDNFSTKRQSLQLLGQLLQTRQNFNVMMKFINDPANLKTIMNLLRCKTKVLQIEAFQVLKMFVANPEKSKGVEKILLSNQQGLISFLQQFVVEDDDEFNEEKGVLLRMLSELSPSASGASEGKSNWTEAASSTTTTEGGGGGGGDAGAGAGADP